MDIAVIGYAGRFPGARDVREFWRNLCAGAEHTRPLSDAVLRASGVPDHRIADPHYVKREAQVDGYDLFDAAFFGYGAREAIVIDPQQRLFLEACWEALEDAGYDPDRLHTAAGVFATAGANGYAAAHLWPMRHAFEGFDSIEVGLANNLSSLPTRVSYKLNLKGPSIAVQTACSSSLVAVHLAVQSLLAAECDVALAGGVFLKLPANTGYRYSVDGVLSPDGRCRPFDADARGTIFGSGVGVVVLKRLEDAQADRDAIRAIVKGTAVTNDGARKPGFSAPSQQAQAEVVMEALGAAGVDPRTVTYVEAHGTGTALGDPIEVAALTDAFATAPGHRCAIGSVKGNIGHLDAAAGVAGLIKTILALEHRTIPPTINLQRPNPAIEFDRGPFRPNTVLREWTAERPLRAGVSSFGLGGTNAHAILEEAPPAAPADAARPWAIVPLSAKTPSALDGMAAQLAAYLDENAGVEVADLAYTYQVGRARWRHRRAVVGASAADLARSLREPVASPTAVENTPARVAFMFPGTSAPVARLAAALYAAEPVFRRHVDECADALRGSVISVSGAALAGDDAAAAASAAGAADALGRARLFAFEYALARLWAAWGVVPDVVRGSGIGELVASAVSGRTNVAEALHACVASPAGAAALDRERLPYAAAAAAPAVLEMGRSGTLAVPCAEADGAAFLAVSDANVADGHVYRILGTLWSAGVAVAWDRYAAPERRRRVHAPTYPFERKRFWVDPPVDSRGEDEERDAGRRETLPPAAAAAFGAGSDEAAIAQIFRSLLLVDEVGRDESFLALGGDSLLATQLASRLRDTCGVTIPLRRILETPTVAAVAAMVAAARGASDEACPIPRVPRSADMPLSFSQQRLWFLDSLTPGTPFYNVSTGLALHGELDEEALEASLQDVVARHEALRTAFLVHDGEPVQAVQPEAAAALRRFDLQDLPARDQDRALETLAREEARAPFRLTSPPLLRVSLIRLAPRRAVVVLTIHHIVADGWSLGVLIHDLAECYRARRTGEPPALDPLAVQYADYASWQRQTLTADALQAQTGYWRERLAGDLPVLALPADWPRPAVQTHRGERQPVEIPADLAQALRALARERQVTLYMVLLAAFATLLHRHAGQDDLLIASPVANRRRSELERLIGCFVNVLVMRVDAGGNPPFDELLRRVRDTALDAYTCQDVPFERLVEELKPPRELSHPPVAQALFALQNTPRQQVDVAGVSMRPFHVDPGIATYDVTLSLDDSGGGISGFLEYNADLFEPGTIRRMVDRFEVLLRSAAARPGERIGELPLLGRAERRRVLDEFNPAAHAGAARTVDKAIAEQARRAPEAIALWHGEQALSYRALDGRANQLARYLQRFGAGPDVVIGLCLERSLDAIVGLLAILKAGAAYLPLDPAYPPERLAYILNDAHVPAILTNRSAARRLPPSAARAIDLSTVWDEVRREPETAPPSAAAIDSLAYVIYTSGSTGKPKGVMVTHRGLENVVRTAGREFAVSPHDRVLLFTSLSFDASVLEMLMALGHGAQLVLTDAADLLPTPRFVEMLRRLQITSLATFPSAMALLEDDGVPALRTLIVGGEPCPRAVIDRWRHGRRMFNSYGPCEATIWATSGEFDASGRVSIGRPIPEVAVYILDAFLEPVPIGVPGELHVAGVGLARGYLDDPAETADRFVPNPFTREPGARMYRTGDRGRWMPNGRVELVGRMDDQQVKVQGVRIELRDVEAAILEHPAIQEAIVKVDGDAERRMLVAYVVAGARDWDVRELRAFLSERLPGYMIPSIVTRLDRLPLLPSGKIDYRALPAPDPHSGRAREASSPPASDEERRIAAIVESVLRVGAIGRDDDIFELGAHSLLVAQLKSRLDAAFGCDLPMVDLFRHPTVAGIAQRIAEAAPPAAVVEASRSRAGLRKQMRERRNARAPARDERAVVGIGDPIPEYAHDAGRIRGDETLQGCREP